MLRFVGTLFTGRLSSPAAFFYFFFIFCFLFFALFIYSSPTSFLQKKKLDGKFYSFGSLKLKMLQAARSEENEFKMKIMLQKIRELNVENMYKEYI